MSYLRSAEGEVLASLNSFSEEPVCVTLPEELDPAEAEILLSNLGRENLGSREIVLEPWECVTAVWKA